MVSGPLTRGFNCSNCGAAVELRALTHARSVACTSCAAILDPRDPNVYILQTAGLETHLTPTIPLGTRGSWHGHPHEVVGFAQRTIAVDGVEYSWLEYVLFNPYRGFRYLSEFGGHWNDIRTVRDLPSVETSSARRSATHEGVAYRHFQHATARVTFVLGEFPWRVRVGDEVTVDDYIAPPSMLSSETTADETTWSIGTYTEAREIWRAFALPGAPAEPSGVFANQPSPYAARKSQVLVACGVFLLLLLAVFLGRQLLASRERVFAGTYAYQPATASSEAAFVTDTFQLRAPGTVEIGLEADVSNSWLDFDLALINTETGTALNVEREVSYYSGYDADGSWSEGGRRASVLLPEVAPGEYYLRVEPSGGGSPTGYSIRVRRDVPSLRPYPVALALLLVPPLFVWIRALLFEGRRWQESDYGTASGESGDDEAPTGLLGGGRWHERDEGSTSGADDAK